MIFSMFATLSTAFAGGIVEMNPAQKEIVLKSHLIFYGPEANRSEPLFTEIKTLWGAPGFKIAIGEDLYAFRLDLTSEVMSEAAAIESAKNNFSQMNNYILVKKGFNRARSYVSRIGQNTAVFYLSDTLGMSTVASHEFGHLLGLPHPDAGDWRELGVPAVMCPNGTLVEPKYQIDPKAIPGEENGSVRFNTRQVLQFDINSLKIYDLEFVDGKAHLGKVVHHLIASNADAE
jgi:hypothetical protein